ncbi:alpha/beta fold hydrolase [Apibacter sp. HY039]|uniref:alpha/beta fold hydrolase n=1 Tax=Apibacter sp. HY039 TaxID=2501476 RepID=UPI000FEB6C6F|nr:alpha/beta hydrolase [Apibacter sp. HY039]
MIHKTGSELFEIKGKKLYAEWRFVYENRPVLVFLHDSLGCVELWRRFPFDLAQAVSCNVLIYDRLGYGKSEPMPTHHRPVKYLEYEADILNHVLNFFKIDQAILFGHSDGGSLALITAGIYAKKIKAVIVEAAHIFVEDITLSGIYLIQEIYKNSNLAERLQKYHGNKAEMVFKSWTETWIRNDFRDWNIKHLLPSVSCPLLFIQGEEDEYGTLTQVDETVRNVNGKAEKYIIPNVGHTPHKEIPELVLKKSTTFINSLFDF